MSGTNVVYFQLNNWMPGDDYPDVEPFNSWLAFSDKDGCDYATLKLMDENWVKENKLCIVTNLVDMSLTFRISATKEWVNKNCPELLSKYKQFIVCPDECGDIKDKFGYDFLLYKESNIGIKRVEE